MPSFEDDKNKRVLSSEELETMGLKAPKAGKGPDSLGAPLAAQGFSMAGTYYPKAELPPFTAAKPPTFEQECRSLPSIAPLFAGADKLAMGMTQVSAEEIRAVVAKSKTAPKPK